MKLKTNVGQIFLSHISDKNFTSLYEETFTRQEKTIELFLIIEVDADGHTLSKDKRLEYEKLTQTIVGALKRAYIASSSPNADTFEKALAAINAAISRFSSKEKMHWYGKLNAGVAVILDNSLSLSVTGNTLFYIFRENNPILLSQGLAENNTGPMKIFSNFSTGALLGKDRILLTTHQLFNYLALDRLLEFIQDPLDESCHEIITALSDIKDTGFVAFLCEVYGDNPLVPAEGSYSPQMLQSKNYQKLGKFALSGAINLLWTGLKKIVKTIIIFFRNRPKKYLFFAIGIILILLISNIAYAIYHRKTQNQKQGQEMALQIAETKINETEAILLYDENQVGNALPELERALQNIQNKNTDKYDDLQKRLSILKSKFSRELRIEHPTLLATFPTVPTDLIHSSNGFMGWNRDSKTLAFYDFRSGLATQLLKNQNTSALKLLEYAGENPGYLFVDDKSNFRFLNIAEQRLTSTATSSPAFTDQISSHFQAIDLLTSGDGARLYLLDTKQKKIWRTKLTGNSISRAESWIKSGDDNLTKAMDISIDGSIYVLYQDSVEKFFAGQKQTFQLSTVSPKLEGATKIFTHEGYEYLYIADPKKQRILIFKKDGKLHLQVTSPKFADLSDIYVDEKNKLIQALSGSELLQINF